MGFFDDLTPTSNQPGPPGPNQGTAEEPVDFFADLAPTPPPNPNTARFGEEALIEETKSRQDLTARGFNIDGAPATARFLLGLAPNPESPEEAAQFVSQGLSAFFGGEVPVGIDEKTGQLFFADPSNEGQKTIVNPPGADFGDFAAAAPQVGVAAADVGGAAIGLAVGTAAAPAFGPAGAVSPPTGVLAGSALGTYYGELARLKVGRDQGVHNLSDGEIAAQARRASGFAAGAGATVSGLARITRLVLTGGTGQVTKGLADDVGAQVEEADALIAPIRETTGRDVAFSARAVLGRGDATVDATQRGLQRSSATSGIFRQQRDELNDAVDEFLGIDRTPVDDVAPGPDAFSAGTSINQATPVGPTINRLEQRVARAESDVRAAEAEIESSVRVGRANLAQETGASTREVLEREVQLSKELIGREATTLQNVSLEEFGAIERPIQAIRFEEVATRIDAQSKNNLLSSLNPEDRAVGEKVLEALGERADLSKRAANLSYDEAAATLSFLKRTIRKAESGIETNVDIGALKQVEIALERDIGESLARHPKTLAQWERFRRTVFNEKERLDRTIVGELLSTRASGREITVDEGVFNKIFPKGQLTNAQDVASILRRPRSGMAPEDRQLYDTALNNIRESLRSEYLRKVFPSGRIKPGAHKKFIEDHGEAAKLFFTKDEFTKIEKTGGLIGVMERRAQALDFRGAKVLNSRLGSLIDPTDARKTYNNVWQKGSAGDMAVIKRRVSRNPEQLEELRATVQDQLRRDTSSRIEGREVMDFRKLDTQLKTHGKQLEVLYGREYVGNLRRVQLVLQKEFENFNKGGPTPSFPNTAGALQHIGRAYVGLFTTPGRFLTAAQRLQGRRAATLLTEAMADSRVLKELVEKRAARIDSPRALGMLAGLGALEVVIETPQAFGSTE